MEFYCNAAGFFYLDFYAHTEGINFRVMASVRLECTEVGARVREHILENSIKNLITVKTFMYDHLSIYIFWLYIRFGRTVEIIN